MPSTDRPSGTPIDGAVALVTGSNRGFGLALVDELLERGAAKVYATSRSAAPERDPRIVPLILDVSDDASVAQAAQAAPDVSILVNNVGILLATPVLSAPLSDIRDELETNLFGIIRVARGFAPILADHPPSSMVNVLSVLSCLALGTGYEISKSAAWSATNSLRLALREQGTTVTALHVACMDTDMATRFVDAPKADPRDIACQTADAIIAGEHEILADDTTRAVKSAATNELSSFQVHVPDQAVTDLHNRIRAARWPEKEPVTDWSHGVPLSEARDFVAYWASRHDWRRLDAEINSFGDYRTLLDSLGIHFIHSESPHPNTLPLILTHADRSLSSWIPSDPSSTQSDTAEWPRTPFTWSFLRSQDSPANCPRLV